MEGALGDGAVGVQLPGVCVARAGDLVESFGAADDEGALDAAICEGVREGTIAAEGLGKGLGQGFVGEVDKEGGREEGAFAGERRVDPVLEEEPEAVR